MQAFYMLIFLCYRIVKNILDISYNFNISPINYDNNIEEEKNDFYEIDYNSLEDEEWI